MLRFNMEVRLPLPPSMAFSRYVFFLSSPVTCPSLQITLLLWLAAKWLAAKPQLESWSGVFL